MRKCYGFILVLILSIISVYEGSSQSSIDQFLTPSDTFNQKRFNTIVAVNSTMYTSSFVGLYFLWYSNFDQSDFHFFNDSKEWQQMDKAGHLFTGYAITANHLLPSFYWAGYDRKKSIWISSATAWVYLSTIEVFDGFSTKWGASVSDIVANTLGVGLAAWQASKWKEQRMYLKYSTHYKDYGSDVSDRVQDLYGSGFSERFFKDYNASSVWVSANISSFIKSSDSKFPPWLNVAIGYGANGMYGGFENIWENENGITIDRTDIPRYRQYYLSLDVDFRKLPIKSKAWKTIAHYLNSFKLPFPALEYNKQHGVSFHSVYF